MKDEKLAEEEYCKWCKLRMEQCLWAWRNTNGLNEPNEKNCSCKEVPAFLAGLKAGRPQWHDLRKDENDLPKDDRYVLIATQKRVYLGFYDCCWFSHETDDIGEVYAWCEIPTFDKE